MSREALEPRTAIALFSGSLGLKTCCHNLGGDTSHVEIPWPVVMDAEVLVAGFLCVALLLSPLTMKVVCSYPQNVEQVCLDGFYLTVICS